MERLSEESNILNPANIHNEDAAVTRLRFETPVQQFFAGSNIFITGGTGFLGKILISKLLLSCPSLENIYLLVRQKKGIDVHSRLESIFEDSIFDTVKNNVPKYRHKVHGIQGDCMLPGLGMTSFDKQTLVKNVNIVFHMAATVRFDEKLKIAMQINVQACKDIMQLCSEMQHLKSAVHVSTAYTQCPLKRVEEKIYEAPIDSGKMLLLTECLSENLLNQITPIILDKWPNTYTFTKAIAEDVVVQHGQGMPVGIFRPGIVISTYRDPIPGWIDNFYGPTGIIAGAGSGVLRTLRCNPNAISNMVPVDMCVNGIITAAWDISERYNSNLIVDRNLPIYNYCASDNNKLTWGEFTDKTTKYGLMYPTIKSIWYLCYTNNPNKYWHMIYMIFLHYLPGLFFDCIALVLGKKPRLLSTYKKIHRLMDVLQFFSMREWEFEMDNTHKLWDKLDKKDKAIFPFDMDDLNWDMYLQDYFRGIRLYILKDTIDTIPEARAHWRKLYWLHQGVKLIAILPLIRFMWFLLSFIR